jgi:hypothetical protein
VTILELAILPSDYIIKTIKESDEKTVLETIFVVRAIKIKNTLKKEINIKKLQFCLKSKGDIIQKISYSNDTLSKRAEEFKRLVDYFGTIQEDPISDAARAASAELFLGQEFFWKKDNFTSTSKLKPKQETGFRLEAFKIITTEPIDELESIVKYKVDDKIKSISNIIPIIEYENKNKYQFPLKGAWLVWGNWDDVTSHRTMHSQEFGFDLVQLNDDLMLPQVGSTPNEAFKMYKSEVMAIADGVVVDCCDGSPENPTAPEMLPKEKRREIAEKFGFVVVASGNYVIIEHPKNEFSFYAHLAKDSVKVKKGQKVKQGQVIGLLGNSGNSTGPHLHLQLMAGPSILTGRGLPCHFTNIISLTGEKISLIQNNLEIVHTVEE